MDDVTEAFGFHGLDAIRKFCQALHLEQEDIFRRLPPHVKRIHDG